MTDKSDTNQFFHAYDVTKRSAKNHSKGKSPKGRTENPSDLFFCLTEFGTPDSFQTGTEGKSHCGYNQRNPAGQEKLVSVNVGLHIVLSLVTKVNINQILT
jgi:hypothetical protein